MNDMISPLGITAAVILSAIASSRSEYWQTVLCRLWLVTSGLWIIFAYNMRAVDNLVNWPLVVLPPIGVLLFGATLHWIFKAPSTYWHRAPTLSPKWRSVSPPEPAVSESARFEPTFRLVRDERDNW